MPKTIQARALLLIYFLVAPALLLKADTIYQATADGRQRAIQRDAILVHQDSSIIIYKHFDLPDMRVEKVQLSEGSLPYMVVTSSIEQRQGIVELWKRFGYTANVTDTSGKTTQVFDAYIDYYPPGGRGSLLVPVPAITSFPLLMSGGAADIQEFSKIDRVDFQNGEVTLTLRNGHVEHGKYLMPITQPAEARFMGISDKYNSSSNDVFDFSEPLYNLKTIVFQQ
ncbi:MAG: hypothetical protein EPN47_01260 [Acidobacteria bacterium]|nr:MAG: hypothetical protein EPN47_01260 [Acidobacteriota bacterium]